VWYEDFAPLGKNPNLMPKWQGPTKVTDIYDTTARTLLPNSKTKVLNVMRLKSFSHHQQKLTVTILRITVIWTLTVSQKLLAQ
jgi:hypothetical protein